MHDRRPSIAVIGCGYWGKNLVRVFYELGVLRAICDTDDNTVKKLGAFYNVPITTSKDELLNDDRIEAIAIAAPAAQHFVLAKEAMLAGKDVFVEKPLALVAEQGQELVDLARRSGKILMVGHLLQYHPAVVELKRLVQRGDFGKLRYITSSRLNWGKLRVEENILWSFAPHDISAILFLLNEQPSSVLAHAESYLNNHIADVTLTTLEFSSGASAHIFVSWLHPVKEQKLVVVGERMMAVFDDTKPEKKLVAYQHRIDWVDRIPVALKDEGQEISLPQEEPLRRECQHFLDSVLARSQPLTDGENGLRVLRILRACEESIKMPGKPRAVLEPVPKYFSHPSAVVDQPCEIGEGTKIWHFTHVMAGCVIGKHCNLGQNVNIAPGVRIGDNVKIQNNVSIYTGVELEDDVFCGPSVVFTNVATPRSYVDRKNEYISTLVRKGATLGANCTIICGCKIGAYAFVAAGAVVTHDVPDYALIMGVPGRQVGSMCECGVRLRFNGSTAQCSRCYAHYRMGTNGPEREQSYAQSA